MPDRRSATISAAATLTPGAAAAHSPIEGLDGFFAGMLHPLSTPSQVLALIALGLLVGRRWPEGAGAALTAFAGTLAGGMALGQAGLDPDRLPPWLLAVALAAAALAALADRPPLWAGLAVAIAAGLLIGGISTPYPGAPGATAVTLAGSLVGAWLAMLYATGATGWLAERFPAPWMRIGQRIAAAWVAAIAALILALAIVSG